MSGWRHTDPRGWDAAIAAGWVRAASGRWDATLDSVADLRALLMGCAAAAAQLSTAAPPAKGAASVMLPTFTMAGDFPANRPELAAAAGAFLRTIPLLSGGGALRLADPTIRTTGGGPVLSAGDAAGLDYWEAAKTSVELALLGPFGAPLQIAYAASNAQRMTIELSGAGAEVRVMMIHLDALKTVVLLHQAGEMKVGHAYPWTEPELRVLQFVLEAQDRVARQKNLLWLVPQVDPFSFLRPEAWKKAGETAVGLLTTFAIAAGLATAAWVIWETKKR